MRNPTKDSYEGALILAHEDFLEAQRDGDDARRFCKKLQEKQLRGTIFDREMKATVEAARASIERANEIIRRWKF